MTSKPSFTRHAFGPVLHMFPREDGRYDVEVYFGDSYLDSDRASGEWGYFSDEPEVEAACAALDKWLERFPKKFVIDGPPLQQATYHGIVKVECLTCGYETTNVEDMEVWNDLGVACLKLPHAGGTVRWTLADGTVRITTQNLEGELVHTEEVK